jgi:hypothetical protein
MASKSQIKEYLTRIANLRTDAQRSAVVVERKLLNLVAEAYENRVAMIAHRNGSQNTPKIGHFLASE